MQRLPLAFCCLRDSIRYLCRLSSTALLFTSMVLALQAFGDDTDDERTPPCTPQQTARRTPSSPPKLQRRSATRHLLPAPGLEDAPSPADLGESEEWYRARVEGDERWGRVCRNLMPAFNAAAEEQQLRQQMHQPTPAQYMEILQRRLLVHGPYACADEASWSDY